MTAAAAAPAPATSANRSSGSAVRFLIAAGTSAYGDWLSTVALVVLLYRLTGGVMGPALYILVRVAPRFFGPAFGGALADKIGANLVAASCALAQAVLTAGVVLIATGGAVWAIYVTVAAAQFIGSMAQPAYAAVIPRVVAPANLRRINGAYSGIFESSVLVAPALGAVLLTHATPLLLIDLDACTFLVAAALLLTVRLGPAPVVTAPARRTGFAGVRIVAADPMLRALAAGHVCSGIVVTCLQAVLVLAAAQLFGHDVAVGWLYAAVGAGGVAGSIAAMRIHVRNVSARLIVAGTLLEVVPLAAFALADNAAMCMALLFVSTFCGALYQTVGSVGLQERVPEVLLGRVNAVIRQALYGGMLLGAVATAALDRIVEWVPLVLVLSALSCLVLVALNVPRRRTQLRGAARPALRVVELEPELQRR